MFNTGETIYFLNSWDCICKGTITAIVPGTKGDFYEVELESINGIKSGGSTGCRQSDAYATWSACVCARDQRNAEQVQTYCDQIRDAGDLVRFLLTHNCVGEDCNENARKAALYRAKDFGFDTDDLRYA